MNTPAAIPTACARMPCTRIPAAMPRVRSRVLRWFSLEVHMIHRVFAIHAHRRTAAVPLAAALCLFHAAASCALPDVSAIGAPEGSNYMKVILFVVGLGIGVAALILGGGAFLEVAGGILGKFNEWRIGRAEAGDLKKVVVAGAVVLALVILLATIAISVIDSSSTITG
jgi:hypothetical protein